MKLWQKISALCICILLVVVVVCSMLLLYQSRKNILDAAVVQAQAEQQTLVSSFRELAQLYVRETDSPAVRQSGIKSCFSQCANSSSVLVVSGETLYSSVGLRPEAFLPIDFVYKDNSSNEQEVFLDQIDKGQILIVGTGVTLFTETYLVYTVKDITEVYRSLETMAWRFVVICAVSLLAGFLLIIWLVRHVSKSLILLKTATSRIAAGEYGERVHIDTRDEVGDLATVFNVMANAVSSHIMILEEVAKRRQFFINSLTHEFKTPMTSMMIHSDTLLSTDLNPDIAQNSLAHIYAQCRWLDGMTQKLLKLITLEQEIQTHSEDMRTLLEDVMASTAEALQQRQTPLETQCEADSLTLDYDLVKSLLINLVDNASKASDPGQTIYIRAYGCTVEVKDCGHGIPEDEIAHITDPFYMVDRSRSKSKGGSGLGLALVQHIANAHKAQLIIESALHIGTTVKVVFPM